ncbi:hypothetical protein FRB99_000141 [Tulasnella sp. 403]|nr:hypothetical protein FRB99_000141 [Tulasnella sp. 403]
MSDKETPKSPEATVTEGETAPVSEDEMKGKALKQVEFYFSDSNLPYDKFMWTLHTKAEDHWVPIATIAGFKRMSDFQKYGTPWLAEVLRGSETLLEVDEAGEKVRRGPPVLPPGKAQFENSVYAKGFPDETPDLQKRIEEFFEQYSPVAGVRMRRTDKSEGLKFKNSAFCEFKTKAGAEAFLSADPKPTFDGKELLTMSKDAYVDMKAKEKGFKVNDKFKILTGNIKRGFNAFKLMAEEEAAKKGVKVKVAGDESCSKTTEKEEPKMPSVFWGAKEYVINADGTINESELEFEPGKVLRYTGAGDGELDHRSIRASLQEPWAKGAYITKDYQSGDFKSGFMGFDKVLAEEEIEEVKKTIPEVCGQSVEWSLASGDDERRFWITRLNSLAKSKLRPKGNSQPQKRKRGDDDGNTQKRRKQDGGKQRYQNQAAGSSKPKGGVPTVAATKS